jgi:mono/diheme cytochrome c family protein
MREAKASARRTWTTSALALTLAWFSLIALGAEHEAQNTGMADASAFVNAFDRATAGDPGTVQILSLSNLRGLSSEPLNAGGTVRVDLTTGAVTSTVRLLPQDGAFDLWLVDNRPGPGHTTLAESSDVLLFVGPYTVAAGMHRLSRTLEPSAFTDFFPDRAFVVRSGDSPLLSFVLTGPATTFSRLLRRQVRFVDDETASLGFDPTSLARRAQDFAKLVADGRRLFLTETFAGNGRTCGTCHVETNNFTVDPEHISTLPPSDPLFVAETNPALATLENPDLMRRLGLILVNADGFDASATGPAFVLRATQNVQALANSSAPPTDASLDFTVNVPNNPTPPERLGWGNDGAPLRDFALVAIAQHAPRTLSRKPGADFRVPTDEELDALVAYQLSLGRQEDFNLPSLLLRSDLASRGKALYLDTGNLQERGHKNCNACHFNGGGTAALTFFPQIDGFPDLDGSPRGFNMTAETNANAIPLALGLPRDGGFGQFFLPDFRSFGNAVPVIPIGLEGFNSPPLVESADTAPFFHNHAVTDLESAVAFYGTTAFQTSIFGPVIPVSISADPTDPEVEAIAVFLRVLNALENIRSSINVAERAATMTSVEDKRELAGLTLAETADAMQVLSEGSLGSDTEPSIQLARVRLLGARLALEGAGHLAIRDAIDNLLDVAIRQLRAARSALADPASLPPSFQK